MCRDATATYLLSEKGKKGQFITSSESPQQRQEIWETLCTNIRKRGFYYTDETIRGLVQAYGVNLDIYVCHGKQCSAGGPYCPLKYRYPDTVYPKVKIIIGNITNVHFVSLLPLKKHKKKITHDDDLTPVEVFVVSSVFIVVARVLWGVLRV
jgi:hypothetical protein